MAKNYVEFFNGCKMPIVGLGTWQAINQEKFEDGLESALEMGYRLIDTAYMSTNEDAIGKVLKKWLDSGRVTRKELFIVTKLPPIGMRPEHVPHFLDLSLTDLQLDYVDLYLVHFPIGFNYVNDSDLYPIRKDGKISIDKTTNLEAIWKAMESQVKKGFAKSIGVSNFSISQMERILKVAKIQPANHQVELHAYYQQIEMQQFCKKHKITLCAYASLGSPGRKEHMFARVHNFVPISLMEDPVVVEMARQHNRTPAQILLRFLTHKNIVVIPKSTNEDHLKMNFEILDFRLTTYDITRLEALDKGDAGKTFHSNIFAGVSEHPEYSN